MRCLNIKRIASIIVIVFLTLNFGYSQNGKNLDFNEIGRKITKKMSKNYYPKLLKKYHNTDTTLTIDQYKLLYYGYTFHRDYNPYDDIPLSDSLTIYKENNDFEKMLLLGKKINRNHPFYLEAIFNIFIAYKQLNNVDAATIWHNKYMKIIQTIFSSGDGKTAENAFVIISIRDEYELLSVMGLKPEKQQLIEKCDRITITKPNKLNIDYLYFNIEKLIENIGKQNPAKD